MEKKKHNMKIRLEDLMWEKRVKSINALSAATEISRQTLHRIYNNESDGIRLETIEKLCNYLDCEIEELLVIEKKIEGVI
jgi:putative transcriptional regulator